MHEILGFSFKANTNDTRESAAISICKDLIEEGSHLQIHDPKVKESQIEKDLGVKSLKNLTKIKNNSIYDTKGNWLKADNVYQACEGVDAIVVLTEWIEYSKIDWKSIAKEVRFPTWVFDARSILNSNEVLEAGLNLWKIGYGFNNDNS